jgi:hypothetical protein
MIFLIILLCILSFQHRTQLKNLSNNYNIIQEHMIEKSPTAESISSSNTDTDQNNNFDDRDIDKAKINWVTNFSKSNIIFLI